MGVDTDWQLVVLVDGVGLKSGDGLSGEDWSLSAKHLVRRIVTD